MPGEAAARLTGNVGADRDDGGEVRVNVSGMQLKNMKWCQHDKTRLTY